MCKKLAFVLCGNQRVAQQTADAKLFRTSLLQCQCLCDRQPLFAQYPVGCLGVSSGLPTNNKSFQPQTCRKTTRRVPAEPLTSVGGQFMSRPAQYPAQNSQLEHLHRDGNASYAPGNGGTEASANRILANVSLASSL